MDQAVTTTISVSLPKTLIARIDELRGDVPRSTYIARLLEISVRDRKPIAKL